MRMLDALLEEKDNLDLTVWETTFLESLEEQKIAAEEVDREFRPSDKQFEVIFRMHKRYLGE